MLIVAQLQRGQDASLAGGRRPVAGREQVFEFALYVLGGFAEFGPFFDEVVAAFAAGGIDAAGNGKNIPVVVVTGYNHYHDWMTVNEFNVKAFFVKPVTMQLLKFTIADLLKAPERT